MSPGMAAPTGWPCCGGGREGLGLGPVPGLPALGCPLVPAVLGQVSATLWALLLMPGEKNCPSAPGFRDHWVCSHPTP